jgi:methylmalonyl-CoA mutase N-terminal domain/subunit
VLPERLQGDRVRKLKLLKGKREESAIEQGLERLRKAAEQKENLMPAISAATKSGCSVGEMSDALRGIYGVYKARSPF